MRKNKRGGKRVKPFMSSQCGSAGAGDKYKALPRREQSDRVEEDCEENKEFICEGQEASRSLTQNGGQSGRFGEGFRAGGRGRGSISHPHGNIHLTLPARQLTFPNTAADDDW